MILRVTLSLRGSPLYNTGELIIQSANSGKLNTKYSGNNQQI